jgi:hypothetical protein
MELAERIAEALTPHLGAATADSVARHLCAKHGIGEGPADAGKMARLREEIRRGLVAFVGASEADSIAASCIPDAD